MRKSATTTAPDVSIDDRGRHGIAADKLRQLLREPEFPKWRIDIATSNIALLPKAEALACLQEYRVNLQKAEQCYRDLADYLTCAGCPGYRQSLAQRPIHLILAELAWIDAFTAQLAETP
jgi:hypothetical protein